MKALERMVKLGIASNVALMAYFATGGGSDKNTPLVDVGAITSGIPVSEDGFATIKSDGPAVGKHRAFFRDQDCMLRKGGTLVKLPPDGGPAKARYRGGDDGDLDCPDGAIVLIPELITRLEQPGLKGRAVQDAAEVRHALETQSSFDFRNGLRIGHLIPVFGEVTVTVRNSGIADGQKTLKNGDTCVIAEKGFAKIVAFRDEKQEVLSRYTAAPGQSAGVQCPTGTIFAALQQRTKIMP